MISKARLAIMLSKLGGFSSPIVRIEQYTTDSEIAADLLWSAYNLGDIKGKVIADLGAGTGILGIGALILGAKMVYFVECDKGALDIAKHNLTLIKKECLKVNGKTKFICEDINAFMEKADVVVQNPPFGIKKRHADKEFIEKAFKIANVAYSLHKSESKGFIEAISRDYGFEITHAWHYKMPLKASYSFHMKRIERISVNWFRILKIS